MKVGIVGHGFVGRALENGIKDNVEKCLIDPKYNNTIKDLKIFLPEIVFLCVPTPMNKDGSQDISILDNIIDELVENSINCPIVIKSTVLPDKICEYEKRTPSIIYNPEFLREKTANEDFINSELIIFGGKRSHTNILEVFYKDFSKCVNKNYIHTDLKTASFVKYAINTFLATKVTFFNELFNLYKKSGAEEDWKIFIDAISNDKRIGSSHMNVPGPDGRFGYGGACFPKDSTAFYEYSKNSNSPLNLLKKSIDLNNEIRGIYKENISREDDQNIKFD